jgi:hypothetical protein
MGTVEYRDLLVAVWSDETPGFFAAKAQEEFGRSTAPMRVYLPFDDRWFVQYADRLDELNTRELHYVGARLFDSLFQGEILRLYVHLLEQIRNTGARLRIRLQIEPPIVARLPWECLYDTRNGVFFGATTDMTLVRYRPPSGAEPLAVAAHPPLRVLLAAEFPSGHESGGVSPIGDEARSVRAALGELEAEGVVEVFEAGTAFGGAALDADALTTVLARNFDILHLICDASWNGTSARFELGTGGIALEALARAVRAASPCFVVWSGGAVAGAAGPALADALLDSVPAVSCHRQRMTAELLVAYMSSLYRSVGAMDPIDTALSKARSSLLSQSPADTELLWPAVYLSRRDATVLYKPNRGVVSDVYQISEGRYRRHLRESLNRFWPKPERYYPQHVRWIASDEPLTSYMHAADFLGQPQGPAELAHHFQRLLIFGEAGSGKTMTLYRLFYEAAQPILSYEAKSPLPVYVALPDLGESDDLYGLLASGFDPDLFASDLEEGRFVFLMDSLDGLSAHGASRRADALNAFMHQYPLNRYVVTAREPAPKPVDIANTAEMLPLAEWEALDFLIADEAIRPEAAKLLFAQLSQGMGRSVGNPQLLAVARRLWREGARVPNTLTEIFLAFFKVAGASLSSDTRESLLPQLAFFMSKGDRLSLSKEHLENDTKPKGLPSLAQEVAFRSTGAKSADELLAEVEKTRLLRGPRAFTFPNVAFQEFLTAYSLRFAPPTTVMSLIPPADWRELGSPFGRPVNLSRGPFHGAMPYLCGLREDGAELVEMTVGRDLVLASACFRETRFSTNIDLVLRAAVEGALESGDELEQRIACLGLEARGDRWAVDWLESVAAEPGNPARSVAVESLGNLRSHRSVPVLENAAEDLDPMVARAATAALARIKAS